MVYSCRSQKKMNKQKKSRIRPGNTENKHGCQREGDGGMGKMGEREWEVQISSYRMNKPRGEKGTA